MRSFAKERGTTWEVRIEVWGNIAVVVRAKVMVSVQVAKAHRPFLR